MLFPSLSVRTDNEMSSVHQEHLITYLQSINIEITIL